MIMDTLVYASPPPPLGIGHLAVCPVISSLPQSSQRVSSKHRSDEKSGHPYWVLGVERQGGQPRSDQKDADHKFEDRPSAVPQVDHLLLMSGITRVTSRTDPMCGLECRTERVALLRSSIGRALLRSSIVDRAGWVGEALNSPV
jgi:hypothetical protein